jgi:cyclohexyl-isocyanide hydratase
MTTNLTRREMALLGALRSKTATQEASTTQHEMHGLKHRMPAKAEQVAMLIYDGMTALDLAAPQQVFGYTVGMKVHVVAKTSRTIRTDTGLQLTPSHTFATCPRNIDLLFVPGGGTETVQLMQDQPTLRFLTRTAAQARFITSVCSGSLILGAAGLLRGYRATSHWAVRDVLALLGATPVEARYVEDRNRITAGGITSGIDFALRLTAKLRGEDYARALELSLEYDPQPPFGTGTPAKAGKQIAEAMTRMYEPLHQAAMLAAQRIAPHR